MSSHPLALALTGLWLAAGTTSTLSQEEGASGQGRVRERLDVETCQAAAGGSRARPNCSRETTVRQETEVKISLDAPTPQSTLCQASVATDYQQRNTLARVASLVKVDACAAASGEFTLVLRTRDEAGKEETHEFTASWRRDDAADVTLSADYPIGENVELRSVRVRRLTCTCAAQAPAN